MHRTSDFCASADTSNMAAIGGCYIREEDLERDNLQLQIIGDVRIRRHRLPRVMEFAEETKRIECIWMVLRVRDKQ